MLQKQKKGNSINFGKRAIGFIFLILLAIPLLFIGLLGCVNVGSDGSEDIDPGTGELIVGLTDSESDFAAYEVDVVSLTLTKQNGETVDALPLVTRVDFAQYVEMTEFLTAATIPVGRYVKAALELDYSNANIQVQRPDGTTVQVDADNIKDESGATITRVSAAVQLQGRNALIIAPGIPAHLTLDFDLCASNYVDLTDPDSPVLTVRPTLVADVNLQNPKVHRLRGPLKEVDLADSSFRLIIRPFVHIISGGDERFGTLRVVATATTVYDINGDMYQGNAGLEALEMQPLLTAVIVIGDLDIVTRQFEATQVYAGSSVPGGTLDVITGNVISRSGNQLTVRGATLMRASGSVILNDEVAVNLDIDTTVSRQLSIEAFANEDVSVGQRIMVFGELDEDETELDAVHVGMLLTTIKGHVISAESNAVKVDLTAIDGRHIGLFDFSGTGETMDADPIEYEVDTTGLDTSGLEAGTPIKLRGFVTPFGHAAGVADFEARTLINVSNVKGLMIVTWLPPSSDGIASVNSENFTLNLDGVWLFHHLNRAGVVIDLTELDDPPIIESPENNSGLFQIVQDGRHQFFFTFDGFTAELSQRLDDGDEVIYIIAIGGFDEANAILSADLVTVALN
jgi:hypothetical protein